MTDSRRENFEVFIKSQRLLNLTLDVDESNQYKNKYTLAAYVIWNYKDKQLKKERQQLRIYKEMCEEYRRQLLEESSEDKALKAAIKVAVKKTPAPEVMRVENKPRKFLSKLLGI